MIVTAEEKKKASELLEESAAPFDAACMMVRQMEAELDRLSAALKAITLLTSEQGQQLMTIAEIAKNALGESE